MTTELIYLKDSYMKEAQAKVIENKEDYVVLDKTIFYPEGGGQPSDTGFLNNTRVIKTKKKGSEIRHYTQKPLEASQVKERIDWETRYERMRMHTAQHLLSAIILDDYQATTAGNQVHEERSRIDFKPWKPEEKDLNKVKEKFNAYIKKEIPVNIYITTREQVMQEIDPMRRNLFSRVPAFVKDIRVVEIKGIDKCPCAGTHVKNTNELGDLNILRVLSKGKDTTRIEYKLK